MLVLAVTSWLRQDSWASQDDGIEVVRLRRDEAVHATARIAFEARVKSEVKIGADKRNEALKKPCLGLD